MISLLFFLSSRRRPHEVSVCFLRVSDPTSVHREQNVSSHLLWHFEVPIKMPCVVRRVRAQLSRRSSFEFFNFIIWKQDTNTQSNKQRGEWFMEANVFIRKEFGWNYTWMQIHPWWGNNKKIYTSAGILFCCCCNCIYFCAPALWAFTSLAGDVTEVKQRGKKVSGSFSWEQESETPFALLLSVRIRMNIVKKKCVEGCDTPTPHTNWLHTRFVTKMQITPHTWFPWFGLFYARTVQCDELIGVVALPNV